MAIDHLFSGIPTADFGKAVTWYEQFTGRPADVVVHEREVMWRMTETGWIYLVAHPARAGNALVMLMVDDLDADLEGLVERGIKPGPVEQVPGKFRKSLITDPEGNRITLGEDLSGAGTPPG